MSKQLQEGKFKFGTSRRTYIPKKRGKLRPLTMPVPADKVVQKAVAIILEIIYEPKMSSNSHGYRPNKGCHTALKQIGQQFNGTTFVVEGDIKRCYLSIKHDIIMSILGKTIGDTKFLALLKKSLSFR
jgi:retron-type reverse transcriptase